MMITRSVPSPMYMARVLPGALARHARTLCENALSCGASVLGDVAVVGLER
jgi:hypothetical protein